MLIKNLYAIESFYKTDTKVEASISINPLHEIFAGHFPGHPVLPGVCQIQIVKELIEKAVEKRLFLTASNQCKFLQMIEPTNNNILTISIDYKAGDTEIAANGIIKNYDKIFLKIAVVFTIVDE